VAKQYLLARLGGANRKILAEEETGSPTGELTRATSLAFVLLTTGAVASLSMFFALHHAVGLSLRYSVLLAVGWGLVIINIDRLLIISLAGLRGHRFKLAVAILLRVGLAALIAFVVATPLVLQIFWSDIAAELPILQEQQSQQFQKNLTNTAPQQNLNVVNGEITQEEKVINGTASTQITKDQTAINTLQGEVNSATSTADAAYTKWQCELGGQKGAACDGLTTGLIGNGTFAKADEKTYNSDEAIVSSYQSQLTTARGTLASDEKIATGNKTQAENALVGLKKQQATWQAEINSQIANDDNQNKNDTGLLAQIDALDAASAKNSGLFVAHWTVTALFFVIEILPVTVKSLMMLGDETPYEKILEKKGQAAIAQADVTTSGETAAVRFRSMGIGREGEHQRNLREARLQREYAVAQAREQARRDVELDMIRRDKGTRIEAGKVYASATREHIMAGVNEWAQDIRDKIKQAAQRRQAANGQQPPNGAQPPQNGAQPPQNNTQQPPSNAQNQGSGQGYNTTTQYTQGYNFPGGGTGGGRI